MRTRPPPISILLVEDDPAHAEIVLRNLTTPELEGRVKCIAHLSDGQQALDYLQREGLHASPSCSPRPDLVLLDLRLPRVDGFEVLRRMKSSAEVSHIPVVVLSTSISHHARGMGYSMATKKVTITLEDDQVAAIQKLVAGGKAASVSGFVKHAVTVNLADVAGWGAMLGLALAQTGGPLTRKERAWADGQLRADPKRKRRHRAA